MHSKYAKYRPTRISVGDLCRCHLDSEIYNLVLQTPLLLLQEIDFRSEVPHVADLLLHFLRLLSFLLYGGFACRELVLQSYNLLDQVELLGLQLADTRFIAGVGKSRRMFLFPFHGVLCSKNISQLSYLKGTMALSCPRSSQYLEYM